MMGLIRNNFLILLLISVVHGIIGYDLTYKVIDFYFQRKYLFISYIKTYLIIHLFNEFVFCLFFLACYIGLYRIHKNFTLLHKIFYHIKFLAINAMLFTLFLLIYRNFDKKLNDQITSLPIDNLNFTPVLASSTVVTLVIFLFLSRIDKK